MRSVTLTAPPRREDTGDRSAAVRTSGAAAARAPHRRRARAAGGAGTPAGRLRAGVLPGASLGGFVLGGVEASHGFGILEADELGLQLLVLAAQSLVLVFQLIDARLKPRDLAGAVRADVVAIGQVVSCNAPLQFAQRGDGFLQIVLQLLALSLAHGRNLDLVH